MNLNIGKDDLRFSISSNITAQLLEITRRSGAKMPSIVPSSLFKHWTECTRFYNYLMTDGAKIEVKIDRVIPSDIAPQCLVGFVELNLEITAFVAVLEFPVEHQECNGFDMSLSLATPIVRDCYVGPDIETIRVFGEKRVAMLGAQAGMLWFETGILFS